MLSVPRRIIILLVWLNVSMKLMGKKRDAGMVVFRQINQNIEYLMLEPAVDGKDWSPPKGRLEEGEDKLTTALRETQEEVGYTIDDLDIYRDQQITVEQNWRDGKIKEVTYFLGRLKTPSKKPVLSLEHREYHWMDKAVAVSLYGPRTEFANMIRKFDNRIRNDFMP